MSAQSSIRILIADDHPIVRGGLADLINRQEDMTVVAEAANGSEALSQFLRCRPDVIIMDLRMPEMDGVKAVKAIRVEYPSARILVLTTYDGDADIFEALSAGASGYLLKDAPRQEIMEAIRAVNRGKRVIPSEVAAKLADRIGLVELSSREMDVLRLVADGKSNFQIASLLNLAEGTVKSHVSSVIRKLDADDRTQAVTVAIRRGILRV